jgi:hypothetical protein
MPLSIIHNKVKKSPVYIVALRTISKSVNNESSRRNILPSGILRLEVIYPRAFVVMRSCESRRPFHTWWHHHQSILRPRCYVHDPLEFFIYLVSSKSYCSVFNLVGHSAFGWTVGNIGGFVTPHVTSYLRHPQKVHSWPKTASFERVNMRLFCTGIEERILMECKVRQSIVKRRQWRIYHPNPIQQYVFGYRQKICKHVRTTWLP